MSLRFHVLLESWIYLGNVHCGMMSDDDCLGRRECVCPRVSQRSKDQGSFLVPSQGPPRHLLASRFSAVTTRLASNAHTAILCIARSSWPPFTTAAASPAMRFRYRGERQHFAVSMTRCRSLDESLVPEEMEVVSILKEMQTVTALIAASTN